jgi:hypothetical protein
MKITGVRVDGYGVLADLTVDELPPGLTVVLGANEAGKSTLLDFIRGVLFGFPDRRHRAPFHEPLRGGRHGGALRLRDEDNRDFVLERHVDARQPVLSGPNGELVDETRLIALLGGADEALFRAVFAFGLGELMAFESLDRDEVRDVVFSAGVLGAGRSATRAGRSLEQRRSEIVRPRRQDARANQLQLRLEELEAQLRAARRAAEGYAATNAECVRLAECVRIARRQADALNHRSAELDRISICWPVHLRRTEAADRLTELGPPAPREAALLARAADVRELATAVSGHEERLQQRIERSGQLQTIETKLTALHNTLDLPPGSLPPPAPAAVVERARRIAEEHTAQLASTSALRDEGEREAREHAKAADLLDQTSATRGARAADVLTGVSLDLGELRRLVRERDQAEAERSGAAREERLARLAAPQHRAFDLQPLLVVLVALSVLGTVGTSLASRSLRTVSLGLAALTVVLIGLVVARALRKKQPLAAQLPTTRADDERTATREARISELMASFGLDGTPTLGALESLTERLDVERANRRDLDDLARRAEEARARFSEASRRYRTSTRRITELEEQARDQAVHIGLAPLSPTQLIDALECLQAANELSTARARVLAGIESLDNQLASFMSLLRNAEEACGSDRRGGDLATRLATLVADVDAAVARRAETDELEAVVAESDEFLVNSLGTGPAAERLRHEIADGDVLSWQEEREHLDEATKEAEVSYEAIRDELKETERLRAELAGSDEIARLEVEREGVAAALDEALSEWLVLGVARSMLDRTLASYERERQPWVIALARDLFYEITDGRYVAVVARDDVESAGRRGIEVIDRAGARVAASDLSRGTAEQLYLCLRLAFATTFAEQAAPLPLVLDDVLVNFDPARAAAVARAVARTAQTHQVLAFTCHPHVVEHFLAAQPSLRVVELAANS